MSLPDRDDRIELMGAERKRVTVLFADLAGFSPLSEQADPETVTRLLNTCFDLFKEIIDRYGGFLANYIGDKIMALFGAPMTMDDHAERALRAALDLRDALQTFNRSLAHDPQLVHLPKDLLALDIHIGIHTSTVVAGRLGSQDEQQYDVIGDAASLAERLMDLADPGQVLLGEATYEQTSGLFNFTPLTPIQIRGKRELHQIYRLTGTRRKTGSLRGLDNSRLHAPLTGRKAEQEALWVALNNLQEGRGGILGIIGEAGVGKSRLVSELRSQFEVIWHESRCLSYGETLSYHPFLGLLRNLINAAPESDVATLDAKLTTFLSELLPDHKEETYPYLANLLGIPLKEHAQSRLELLAGESRQWQINWIFEEILSTLAYRSPMAILIDDLHWADPSSLALLAHLLPLSSQVPILFIIEMRPSNRQKCQEFLSRLSDQPTLRYQGITLNPLSATHSRQLMQRLLSFEALPENLHSLILNQAAGNPLYLEEILGSLINQEIINKDSIQWRITRGVDPDKINLPDSLPGLIQARIDRLDADSKTILQMAAVIGPIFWYRMLDFVALVDRRLETLLGRHLDQLEQMEFICQTRRYPDLEYVFMHTLIQEAAYKSIEAEQRQILHKRVADAMEKIFSGSLEEQYGLLARHYEAAGEAEKAIFYLCLAGSRARHACALIEADEFYRHALALLPAEDEERRRDILFDLGLVNLALGNSQEAGKHYGEAFQLHKVCQPASPAYSRRPMRLCMSHPVRSLNPGMPVELASNTVVQQCYAGLVEFDAELNLLPHMAERWEVEKAGARYLFTLQPEACWSDGAPLVAQDFVTAWRAWMNPDSESEISNSLSLIRGAGAYRKGENIHPESIGVRAVNERVLEVELEHPVAYFLSMLNSSIFYPLPSHCWPPKNSLRDDPAGYVCNGPFRPVEWLPDDTLVLERNPYYCGISKGNLNRIEFMSRLSPEERLGLYIGDQVDVCWARQEEEGIFSRAVPSAHWRSHASLQTLLCFVHPEVPPTDNLLVRQALALSLDRSRLAPFISDKTASPAMGGMVPPGMPGHTPELCPPYDPERARSLLRKAGYASEYDIPPLRFVIASARRSPIFQAMALQWRENLGVRIEMQVLDVLPDLIDSLQSNGETSPNIYSMTWVAEYPDPHNFLADGAIPNVAACNPNYIGQAFQAAQQMDTRARMAQYHALDRSLVIEQGLVIPLWYGKYSVAAKPHVAHFPMLTIAHYPFKDIIIDD